MWLFLFLYFRNMSRALVYDYNFTYLVELDDIRVANLLKNIDLTSDPLNVTLVFNPVLLKNLDGNLLACNRVSSNSDLSKGARAERPP